MTAIAIFVKTPGLSPVKSRLAADIGKDRAEQWHLMAAKAVAAAAKAAAIGPVYWAVAEAGAAQHPYWDDQPVLVQQPGGLGRRMSGIHRHLVQRHGSALLLGADAPQWPLTWLQQAADWLQHDDARLCLGPAHDGGFWTFAANRLLPEADWESVDYSQATTGAEFRQRMDRHGQWLELPPLTDLDNVDALPGLIRELERLEAPTDHQMGLMEWLRAFGGDGSRPRAGRQTR